ncbi:hypothetical protein ABZ897_38255 [Nonomuraea sp. NPDC046802]|uniref:WXG100 family type VII secretion target n=1 Tax=Nonomuraea sp. NPDC046802 TaxID=3154919 RepID=UPI0033DC425C
MKDSEKLRTVAAALRGIPNKLVGPLNGMRMSYPYQVNWKGPAADEFHQVLMGALKDLGALGQDLEAYARKLEREAGELEAKEKREAKEKAGNKPR